MTRTPNKPDRPDEPWTIMRLLEWTRQFFASKEIDDARLEAELLLAHALGLERIQLYAQHGRTVEEPALSTFRELVRRRAQRVPTQYLLGKAWFRSLTLRVTPAVLIPRPETELLVDEALALLSPRAKPAWEFRQGEFLDHREEAEEAGVEDEVAGEAVPEAEKTEPEPVAERPGSVQATPRCLDLCTGSGCVAVALATECPRARIVATDLSEEALEVARQNATDAGVPPEQVTFLGGDLFAALEPLPPEMRLFDLITANPPYIAEGDLAGLMPEVRDHEPRAALVAGATGMEIIDRLLDEAPAYLVAGGNLLMEIGFDQGEVVRKRVADHTSFELVHVRKDLGGHPRVVHLRRR